MSGSLAGVQIVNGKPMRSGHRHLTDWLLDATIYFSFDSSGFRRHQRYAPQDFKVRDNAHVLVTGANSGVGFALCEQLMRRHVQVTLLCRSSTRGDAAIERLIKSFPSAPKPRLLIADITDLQAIDDAINVLRDDIKSDLLPPISCLIHNAGVLPLTQSFSSTGHEQAVAAHLIGPMRLTHALFHCMAEGGRVIFMSSGGMYFAPLSVKKMLAYNVETQDSYDGVLAYALTKRAQVELAKSLHERYRSSGVSVDVQSIHPGWADTPGVESSLSAFHQKMSGRLRTSTEGALPTEWLCHTPPLTESHFWFDWAPRSPYLLGKRPPQSEIDALWNMVSEGAKLPHDWVSSS